jgi:YD repeat-containing protein
MHRSLLSRTAKLCSLPSIVGRTLIAAVAHARVFVMLALLGGASAHAQVANVNTDCRGNQSAPANTQADCTFVPVIGEWRYQIPGPIKATKWNMREEDTKAEYLAIVMGDSASYCSAPHWVGEEPYTSTWDGIDHIRWKPGLVNYKRKTVYYEYSLKNTPPPAGPGGCSATSRSGVLLYANRSISCPDNTWTEYGDSSANLSYCRKYARTPCETCGGNPIAVPSGDKLLAEEDYVSPASSRLVWRRIYRSSGKIHPRGSQSDPYEDGDGLGRQWSHNFERALTQGADANIPLALRRGDGIIEYFHRGTGPYPLALTPWARSSKSRLVATSDASYNYYSADNAIEVYDQGKLVALQEASGRSYTLAYNADGRLAEVRDDFGRKLLLGYDASSGRLNALTDPAGEVTRYEYTPPLAAGGKEGSYLSKVTYADQTSRQYVMQPAQVTGGPSLPHLIYGIHNESGKRYSTYTYSAQGYALSTELAGGVNKWTSDLISLTDPLGATRRNSYTIVEGMKMLSAVSQPAGSGSGFANASYSYDANANVAVMYDFTGKRTCYAYDLTRNLETTRIEGLTSPDACSTYFAAGASLPAGARKISTEWHPDWRIPVREAGARRVVTSVYHGQPDPFAGGAVASCAPADALLVDGKPIAVLCKRVEQATTDANGTSGFGASPQQAVAVRVWQWTYNRWGQVLAEDGPRTDVADVTSYTYYDDTTADHSMGDVQTITNALGQATQFTRYDAHGQLLERIDAKGVVTSHTYDLRLRRTSTTVGGRTTSYSYEPTGDLKGVTQPDGTWIEYTYDDARRIIAVSDNRGNRIAYALDAAGNRVREDVVDAGGTLRRQVNRIFDALGRMQQQNETALAPN